MRAWKLHWITWLFIFSGVMYLLFCMGLKISADSISTPPQLFQNGGSNIGAAPYLNFGTSLSANNSAGVVTAIVANGGIDYGQLASDTLQFATVNVSATQIASLTGTPVALVAAPGANKVIVPISVVWKFRFVTTAYTIGSCTGGGGIQLALGSTSVYTTAATAAWPTAAIIAGTVLTLASSSNEGFVGALQPGSNTGDGGSGFANAALNVTTGCTGGTNFTGGDCTLSFWVTYRIINIT